MGYKTKLRFQNVYIYAQNSTLSTEYENINYFEILSFHMKYICNDLVLCLMWS